MFRKVFFRRVFSVVVAMLMSVSPTAVSYALTQPQMDMFSQNNILFYDPTGGSDCAPGKINGNNVTIIGDSISVGAASEFSSQIPNVDYTEKTYNGVTYNLIEVSKHFAADAETNYGGMTIADAMQNQGDLRSFVVFALGTNDPGAVTESAIDALMNLIGTNHKVVLTTNYAVNNQLDYSVNNAAIRTAGQKYSNVAVADWAAEAEKNPGSYIGDGYVHPSAEGNKVFVSLIKKALDSLAGGSGGVSTGNNRNYAGAQVWSDAEMQAIEANVAIYQEAANKYGFPWQVMAVFHSLETGLRRYNPDNGQGVYQLYSYTAGGTNENRFEPASEISEEEFRRQTLLAAELVSGMVGDLNDANNVKRLFFQYNGMADVYIQKAINMGFSEEEARNGEGSAYVMNRYDAQRDPTSSNMSSLWPGRFIADGVYDETSTTNVFGAFVKYEALAGSSYCGSSAGGSIAEVAINLSWEGLRSHLKTDPKPEYVVAMKEVDAYQQGNGYYPYGASCDQFVGTVMRYSKADPDFPVFGPGRQRQHMIEHPDMYMKVEANGDVSNLQAGDILVTVHNGNHIYLYVGQINNQDYQASASADDRTGEHFSGVYFSDSYGQSGGSRNYEVYRRIGI